jgi:ribosomal protein S18 acetylase RimI-like enzyme
MYIRKASAQDVDALQFLGFKTFYDTFSKQNRAEDMKLYLEENFTPDRIRDELNDQTSFFYIAFQGEQAIGYSKMGLSAPNGEAENNCLEIERIYVDQQHHGQRIGAALMEHCISDAILLKKKYIWLGVWEKNIQAIEFYKKWGFEIFGSHKFKLGNDLQDDLLMKKVLVC